MNGEQSERIEGLRAWLANLDRKVGVRTYAAAAAIVLALAIAIVALVLTLRTQDDAASNADLDAIESQISSVERRAKAEGATAKEVRVLGDRLDDLERRVSRLSRDLETTDGRVSVIDDDIDDLRREISKLNDK